MQISQDRFSAQFSSIFFGNFARKQIRQENGNLFDFKNDSDFIEFTWLENLVKNLAEHEKLQERKTLVNLLYDADDELCIDKEAFTMRLIIHSSTVLNPFVFLAGAFSLQFSSVISHNFLLIIVTPLESLEQ